MTKALREVLTAQLASLDALHQCGILSGWMFHRADGARIRDCRKRWKTACTKAGYPERAVS
jgi:hypothetical protein